jgi:tetratricopeptide (TPR) repeat protein
MVRVCGLATSLLAVGLVASGLLAGSAAAQVSSDTALGAAKLERLAPAVQPGQVLRALVAAGVGEDAAKVLDDMRVTQRGGEGRLDAALVKWCSVRVVKKEVQEAAGPAADKLRAAMSRGEQLLRTGNVQAAYRLLDEVAARAREQNIVLLRAERLLAEAALRAGREPSAREACSRAITSGWYASEDAGAMMWLGAQDASLSSEAKRGLLAQARETLKAQTPDGVRNALLATVENELAKALSLVGEGAAGAELEEIASTTARGAAKQEDIAELWFAQPLSLALSSVRAQRGENVGRAADEAMMAGDAAQARTMYRGDAQSAEQGSSASWGLRTREIAAAMSEGEVEQAMDVLLQEVSVQRSASGERAMMLAGAFVQEAKRVWPARGDEIAARFAAKSAELAQQRMKQARPAVIDQWRTVQMLSVQAVCDAKLATPGALGEQFANWAKELQTSADAQRVGTESFRASVGVSLVMYAAELAKSRGWSAQELGTVLLALDEVIVGLAEDAARAMVGVVQSEAAKAWAKEHEVRLGDWVVFATGDAEGTLARLAQRGPAIGQDDQLRRLQMRALIQSQRFDELALLARVADVRSFQNALPLVHEGWFAGRLDGQFDTPSKLNELSPGSLAVQSLQGASSSKVRRLRSETLEFARVRRDELSDAKRLDLLAVLATFGPEDEVSRSAAGLLAREFGVRPILTRPMQARDTDMSLVARRATELAKQRKYVEAAQFALPRVKVASVQMGGDINRGQDLILKLPAGWMAGQEELVRACDPRVLAGMDDEQVKAARDLVAAAFVMKSATLCHRALAIQLHAMAGDQSADQMAKLVIQEVEKERQINPRLVGAVDEAYAMRGDVRSRIKMVEGIVFAGIEDSARYLPELIWRVASWGTMDDARALVEKLSRSENFATLTDVIEPEDVEITTLAQRKAQVFYQIGGAAHNEMRDLFAMELYREAIKIDPKHAETANNLAYLILERGGDIAEAETLLELAIGALPNRASIVDSVGWLRYRQGRIENFEKDGEARGGAVDWLRRSLRMLQREGRADDNSEITMHLGDALWQRAKLQQATEGQATQAAASREEAVRVWQMAFAAAKDQVQLAKFMFDRDPARMRTQLDLVNKQLAGIEARLRAAGPGGKGVNGVIDEAAMELVIEPMSIPAVLVPRPEPDRPDMKPERRAAEGDPCDRFQEFDPEMFEP